MSPVPEPEPRASRISLYDHARRLHQHSPDGPLPHSGEPYPDEQRYRRR